jgi:hypothetical protein
MQARGGRSREGSEGGEGGKERTATQTNGSGMRGNGITTAHKRSSRVQLSAQALVITPVTGCAIVTSATGAGGLTLRS